MCRGLGQGDEEDPRPGAGDVSDPAVGPENVSQKDQKNGPFHDRGLLSESRFLHIYYIMDDFNKQLTFQVEILYCVMTCDGEQG